MSPSYRNLSLIFLLFNISARWTVSSSASCGSTSGGPTDIPTVTLYGSGAYPWAETMIPWNCVYNIRDYLKTTSNVTEAFLNAQTDALQQTPPGGVIYFPADTYKITTLLPLSSNIVIRGDPTTTPAKSGKNPGKLSPATQFSCPLFSHYGVFSIGTNNSGVVNIDMDGCAIMLWPELGPNNQQFSWPTDFENYWFGATSITSLGKNKLVLSNLIHDVSFGYPSPSKPPQGQNIYPWSFSTAIACYSGENALVGNNLIAKANASTNIPITLQLRAQNHSMVNISTYYPTDNRYGIDVGRVLIGAVASAAVGNNGPCPNSWGSITPKCFPYLFPTGITVRDNYVYQNGRVGVSIASGIPDNAEIIGGGAQIYNNHVEVASNTTCWTVTGTTVTTGSDTNENRGYDIAGYGKNVTFNTGHIHNQFVPFGPYLTVDGEGILQQPGQNSAGLYDNFQYNDMSGSSSGAAIWYYDLLLSSTGIIANNIAGNPAEAFIGVWMERSQDQGMNFTAHNNTPAAQYCGGSPRKCVPIPVSN